MEYAVRKMLAKSWTENFSPTIGGAGSRSTLSHLWIILQQPMISAPPGLSLPIWPFDVQLRPRLSQIRTEPVRCGGHVPDTRQCQLGYRMAFNGGGEGVGGGDGFGHITNAPFLPTYPYEIKSENQDATETDCCASLEFALKACRAAKWREWKINVPSGGIWRRPLMGGGRVSGPTPTHTHLNYNFTHL